MNRCPAGQCVGASVIQPPDVDRTRSPTTATPQPYDREPTARQQRPTFMRTIEDVDAELRTLAAYRAACVADGDPVRTTTAVDRLLDERPRAPR